MKIVKVFLVGVSLIATVNCTTVEQYEVGVGRTRFTGNVHENMYKGLNQVFTKSVFKYSTREQQYPVDETAEMVEVLTSDQLPVGLEVAYLWRVNPESATNLFLSVGTMRDVSNLVHKVYREAVRDVIAEVTAANLFSQGRQGIGSRIGETINENLITRGVEVTEFFVRDIEPPDQVKRAIEDKLAKEQQVQTEAFQTQVITEQAEQRRQEAEGIRDAQSIISQSLEGPQGERYLYWRALEAMENVGEGSNNMVIVPTENGAPIFFGAPGIR